VETRSNGAHFIHLRFNIALLGIKSLGGEKMTEYVTGTRLEAGLAERYLTNSIPDTYITKFFPYPILIEAKLASDKR
jgi:hypothetical protein